jgi:hypothetical protein
MMVYNTQNYWVFGLCPSSGILETRKHNVSETGSVSVPRWGGREDTYSVGSFFMKSFIHSFIHSSMALQPFVGPWLLLQFRNIFYTDGRTPWTSDQPVSRPLPTHRTTHTQTSMPWVGFEPTIPAFERAKSSRPLWSAVGSLRKS